MCEMIGQERTVQPTGGQPAPEAIVQAMRESGQLPAWKVKAEPPRVPQPLRAVLELACGLRVEAKADEFSPLVLFTVPHYPETAGMSLSQLTAFLPRYLARLFTEAALELRKIDQYSNV